MLIEQMLYKYVHAGFNESDQKIVQAVFANIDQVDHLSQKEFLALASIPKTNMHRYLASVGMPSFSAFQKALKDELQVLKVWNQEMLMPLFSSPLYTALIQAKRVFFFGDWPFTSLMLSYLPFLFINGIQIVLIGHQYLTKELVDQLDLTKEDILFIGLCRKSLHQLRTYQIKQIGDFYDLNTCICPVVYLGPKNQVELPLFWQMDLDPVRIPGGVEALHRQIMDKFTMYQSKNGA